MRIKSMLLMLSLTAGVLVTEAQGLKGVDASNLDPNVSPRENFFKYACGGWMKSHPLSPEYARYGTFDMLAENSREQVKELITGLCDKENAKGTIAQKVADMYKLGMDEVRLNAEGAEPVKADLQMIDNAKASDLCKILAWMYRGLAAPFFDISVMADMKDSEHNLLYMSQGGLGLRDRDYYLEQTENTKRIRSAYEEYIGKVFSMVGYKKSRCNKAVKNVMKIENMLANVAMTREETRDYTKLYNLTTVDELKSNYKNIDWDTLLEEVGVDGVDKVCVFQPASLAQTDKILGSCDLETIKDYLKFHYLNSASNYLSDEWIEANFEVYSRALSGKTMMQPRWKRAINVPNTLLGEAVGELYVEKYFPAESKKKMQQLVDNLKRALGEHIATLPWMSAKTKVNALVKLNSFTVKIGYPDHWRDYSAVNVDASKSYWENMKGILQFAADYELSQLNKPVDKTRWYMTPQTVNAYYEPTSNEICFPAGILQPPYFDPNADDASNYGAIGVVIGHEMTHGFDDQGRNFDADGNMVDWWTEEDAKKFEELAKKLGSQYSAEVIADGVHANGEFTMGENIADHGGLRISYSAFKKTDQGKGNEPIDGFTPDQRFFLSYANVWANNITKEEMLRRTKEDPHSLGVNRVNVALRNLEPFFKAFGIVEGDKMFRSVDDRVTIW